MSDKSKQRAKLSVRAEKAMGLPSIKAGRGRRKSEIAAPSAPPVLRSAPVRMPAPVFVEAVKPSPATSPVPPMTEPLFGVDKPFDAPLLPSKEKIKILDVLNKTEVSVCVKCPLCKTRTHTVFGEGDVDAKIFFIGEGPGENEDLTGRPFVGRAGQLLDKMIQGMGLAREQVYIANIVKCRPPNNRVPMPNEVATCTPYLLKQIEVVRPKVIVTLGRPASTFLLNSQAAMGQLRGRWHEWRGIRVMPTYHPSYVLRSYTQEVRAAVWGDLKMVLTELGMKVPGKAGA